ncbi:MAG: HYR domain-containing protein, partial [Planctomycetota bacterium]|nr:HYR domain-containing protein [Planctomycetota bacterium]
MFHRVSFPIVSWSCGVVLLALAALAALGEEPTAPPASAPTITAPSGSGNVVQPVCGWSAVDNASVYDLWIDSITDNVSQVFRQSDIAGTSFTLTTALADNKSYRAWVRPGDAAGWGPWSAAQIFATGNAPVGPPTGVPTITAPIGSGQTTTPTFSWVATDPASCWVDLWVDDLSSGTSQVLRQTHLTGTSFVPTTALPLGDSFRAWMRAGNCFGFSAWSAAVDFATDGGPVAPPADAPSFTAPSGKGNSTSVQVSWTAVTGATAYDLWIDSMTTGQSQVVRETQIAGTTFTPATPLPDNTSFKAWVCAKNAYGAGPWSAAQVFATGNAPVGPTTFVPTLTAPTGRYNTTAPEFAWSADGSGDSTFAELWVDDLTTGTSQVLHETHIVGTSFVPTTPLPDHHSFRAWVRNGNAFGLSAWSAAQDFAIPNAPLAAPTDAPVMTAPSGSGNSTTPTVQWNDVTDALFFDVWIDNLTSGQSQVVRNQHVADTSYAVTTPLAENSSYKAWVRAGNVFGLSPWSNAQVFATGSAPTAPPTGAPTITAPTGTGNSIQPQFSWETVAGATLSDLWLDDLTAGTSQVIREQSLSGTTFTPATPLAANHTFRAWVRGLNCFGSGPWSAAQDFAVTVADIVPPVVTPPDNVVAEATGPGGAIATYPPATATDDVTANPEITYSQDSGTLFHLGVTIVVVTATDAAGNMGTASFTVTVRDTTAPAFTFVPADMVVEAGSYHGAVVSYPAATASDVVTAQPIITYSQRTGTLFPLGETVVTIIARDGASNPETAQFTVTVRDTLPPMARDGSVTTNEDQAVGVMLEASDLAVSDLTYRIVRAPASGSLLGTGAYLVYTPAPDFNGVDSFAFTANDGTNADSNTAMVTITVNPVNDAPSFTVGPNQSTQSGAGLQTLYWWATNISPGPPDEAAQQVWFETMNDNSTLFSQQPAVGYDGTLRYAPATGAAGVATVTVWAHDNGGTANGGVDTSAPQTFTIMVSYAPTLIITTVAGNGNYGYNGDGIPAIAASLSSPEGVAVDGSGNLYIADKYNSRVRKRDAMSGAISTYAGNGSWEFYGDGGPATSAAIGYPSAVALSGSGNLFIADFMNMRVRKVDSMGTISTVAGNGNWGYSGDNVVATSTSLGYVTGLAADWGSNLFIADTSNNRIRRVDSMTRIITTVAGNGTAGYSGDGGPATSATLNRPSGVLLDGSGNLYIADNGNHRIRKVNGMSQTITTVAGNGTAGFSGDGATATLASLNGPIAVALDWAGSLYIVDTGNHRIRKVDAWSNTISTVAGDGNSSYYGDGGPAPLAALNYPNGVAVNSSDGTLYVADRDNNRIRRVGSDQRPTPPSGLTATAAGPSQVNLSWTDTSTNEMSFRIERMTGGGGTYAEIGFVGASVTTYTDTSAWSNTEYHYRVRARNDSGDSSYSNEAFISAPTVAVPAQATPNPTPGATTILSVRGADYYGEPSLIYTWAVVGTPPAAVTFSVNGTNAAKYTTATFAKAGTYNLQVTIVDPQYRTTASSVQVVVAQTVASIAVLPADIVMENGSARQFAATATDQFGNAFTAPPAFVWAVSGGGIIDQSGLFTATTVGGPYDVTASAGGKQATAKVIVVADTTAPTITLNPANGAIVNLTQDFTADVSDTGTGVAFGLAVVRVDDLTIVPEPVQTGP